MWIQEKVADGVLDVAKVAGEWNPADLMTKSLSENKAKRFMQMINQEFESGRATQALEMK